MEKLYNLSIRKKFAVVIVPLIVTIVFFDFFQIREDFLNYRDSKRLNMAINVSYQITHLLHELQRERSIAVGSHIDDNATFSEVLRIQRDHTDSVLRKYKSELAASRFEEIMVRHRDEIAEFGNYERQLLELRKKIDNGALDTRSIMKYYSDINQAGLRLINTMISEARDKAATQQVHAIIYFLEAKEYASIERALGTQIFSSGEPDPNISSEFASLLAYQDAYIQSFLTIADEESTDFYNRTLQGQEIEEVNRMRALLYEGKALNIDPAYWHNVISEKINSMKAVEEFLLNDMHIYTEDLAAESWGEFWTFIMIDVLIASISLFLMGFIVTKLIKDVATLEHFTRRVSKGDLSSQVKIDSKDEIGHYADTFNIMVNQINKTQKALKKSKEYAEYLYENIYKQSVVVFENVEQGIFLLDKDFKISGLYSKAVERIFDNESIANENFCNFMRPRIIQRDYEALEMFMKHLFNPDMDEDVVNQLNPIEQVKIFISTNGVVITKHLRVSFTRIERGSEIHSILVTISDETESVLLQQHMEESESKKKKETEYLLNIFKVDPVMLREFLENTRSMLKAISEKYEGASKSDLNDLLKYTFQVIHNIKGNAMSLGVELISDKLHSIEESIATLKERNVTADKFLALLYEIEEVDKMTSDMSKMLDKVGEVYRNFHAGKSAGTVTQLEESLKKSVQNLSRDAGKDVELDFRKSEGVALPTEYVAPLRDITIQMMRNTLSHGLENPAERISKGKSEKGRITVAVEESADKGIRFTYKDDGKGLDLELIRKKAAKLGVLAGGAEEDLTETELINLLFDGGLSTAEKVDTFSGRGQGMSLVKSIVDDLNGTMSVRTEKDKCFEIIFNLPAVTEGKIKKVA